MKIVIDIPEELWEKVKEGYVPLGISKHLRNGVVLPKGYGKLINMNEIYKALHDEIEREKDCADEEYLEGIRNAYAIIDTSPAVIEADNEVENE